MRVNSSVLVLSVLLAAALPACLQAAKVSDQCCDDLGFPTGKGSEAVCAAADLPDVGCKTGVKGNKARRICKAAGARLCTRKELRNGEGKGTGCGLATELVWTTTRCDGKGTAWVVLGKNGRQGECRNTKDAEPRAGVICCADACEAPEPTEGGDGSGTFYVGDGDINNPPYFDFFSDADGLSPIDLPTLTAGETYRFERIVTDFSHPFGIGVNQFDSSFPESFDVGDGSTTSGLFIPGAFVEFTVPSGYDGSLKYYCFNHANMVGDLM